MNLNLYSLSIYGKGQSFQLIYRFALAVIVIIVVKVVFVYVREYLMSSVQQKILMRFRIDLYNRLVFLPVKYYDENKTGYIMSRITNDVNNLEQSLTMIVEMTQNVVYTIVFATALFYTNWQLTIVSIFLFAFSGEISRKFGDRIRSYSRNLTNTLADISSFLQEKISAISNRKIVYKGRRREKDFQAKSGDKLSLFDENRSDYCFIKPDERTFNTVATSLLVIFCGYLFIQGSMTIETMIFFLMLMINLAKPVKALGESAARIQKTLVSAGYIFEILDLETEPLYNELPQTKINNGVVEFRGVSFAYNGEIQALKDINLYVASGEKIALVGESGGGKSTFINLIPRFYDLEHGKILIDGQDTKEMDLLSLRRQMAIVPQDVVLFSGSVYDNIRYGRLDARDEEIFEAARYANAHAFIIKLEKGYDTEVGERGLQLSGGQRQRIAIARAILRNPKILLLDEATSALDTESERMVQDALSRLMKGRTSFIIAHRLSTIAHCDRIVVLEGGSIVEVGTHEELLRKKRECTNGFTCFNLDEKKVLD